MDTDCSSEGSTSGNPRTERKRSSMIEDKSDEGNLFTSPAKKKLKTNKKAKEHRLIKKGLRVPKVPNKPLSNGEEDSISIGTNLVSTPNDDPRDASYAENSAKRRKQRPKTFNVKATALDSDNNTDESEGSPAKRRVLAAPERTETKAARKKRVRKYTKGDATIKKVIVELEASIGPCVLSAAQEARAMGSTIRFKSLLERALAKVNASKDSLLTTDLLTFPSSVAFSEMNEIMKAKYQYVEKVNEWYCHFCKKAYGSKSGFYAHIPRYGSFKSHTSELLGSK
ncbi:unnamed protein product [Orchesella dallaii]|uniref:C2H2-type domain-containing protein n=1 Tax=Orchesella dallaii TaxID=48710 RepID=A0ABP1Q6N8_9HEXA